MKRSIGGSATLLGLLAMATLALASQISPRCIALGPLRINWLTTGINPAT